MGRRPSARSDFLAAQERGRWRAPLPVDRQAHIPWVFIASNDILVTPFAGRKKLNHEEEAAVSAMRDQLDQLRREGRLPRGTVWVWPDGRNPAPIEIHNDQWLRQRQAHYVTVYA
jgi:hypothetical protein